MASKFCVAQSVIYTSAGRPSQLLLSHCPRPVSSAVSCTSTLSRSRPSAALLEEGHSISIDHSLACDTFDRRRLLYMIARPGL